MARILVPGEGLQIDMTSARHHPELLRFGCGRKQHPRLSEGRVSIRVPGNDQQRDVHVAHVVDRTQVRRVQPEMQSHLAFEHRREDRAGGAEVEAQAVVERFLDRRIHLLDHQCVYMEVRRGEQGGGTAHRYTDETDAIPGRSRLQVINRRQHIEPFAIAERDRLALAFAVRLEVEQQHRIARGRQQAGPAGF
jgi:hypothetical protein